MASSRRGDIEEAENLAALLDSLDERLRLLALHTRVPHLLDEIAAGRAEVERAQQLVWQRREALRRAATDD